MKKIFPVIAALSVSACASVMSGTTQSVFIDTPHVTGAECVLTDSKNNAWKVPSSPATVTVHKGDGPMTVQCVQKGYETTKISVDEELVGATFGNILLGGGIGIIVDSASGAAQKYPDKVTLWMKPTQFKSASERKAWEAEKTAYERQIQEEMEAKKKIAEGRSHSNDSSGANINR